MTMETYDNMYVEESEIKIEPFVRNEGLYVPE